MAGKLTSALLFFGLGGCSAHDWNLPLFERNVQILGLCPDIGNDDPPTPPSPAPSQAPTFVPRNCNSNVGSGICLDANGNAFDSCTKIVNPLNYSRGKCQKAAESVPNSVGWQYGLSGSIPLACIIYFDDVDSQNDVKPLCPEGFGILTTSSNTGTGFPQSGGEGFLGCYSCED
ncbi:hypothetical protein FisN_18Hh051 [Fistulifera solaris]|uniref:Lipoprotein n=1 Tax=Fistulifera solaris TaxID=1519565 RepID=A0A1Z5JVN2_FISSO|nr:hypothetical protein FisN_18Hh051 [Fistulifera solaris]|eukprot:GAX17848.1 hypothetical protein FisN_18Hh051 [Fistulifera solaris]